ncbi:hypothetical protein [Anabaena sp. UHCC 0451]|uniref:hypothetical protein n=1 Tax=Anabaena sp. UHCC 0451 TaxID=2055235 RepID=UPI002B1F6901|nr:hypothetical protein [Anabaena sp. UHCC 0451]MEA5576552.1 hypothetical protein [Anabaena sp. UHCC 0451]
MKLSLFSLTFVISLLSAGIAINPSANANPNQAANLVTEAATINNKWNLVSDDSTTNDASLSVSDPECKKINPLEYINNPETFFQPCSATNNPNRQDYEPVEYLKVPKLDSGLSVTVTNF